MKNVFAWTLGASLYFIAAAVPVTAQDAPKLSDPEVASVAVTANQIDVAYAAIAAERSKSKDVLNFAKTMADDHNAIIAQAAALAKKLGVTPLDNAVTQKLLADAANMKNILQTKRGKAFDKAYIDNEVVYHKAVIGAVETLLIPETENRELKDLLISVLPALKVHLEHAQMLQKKLINL
jgi:putative membrane protein